MSVSTLRREWASNIRGDVLAGMTGARALIPEAIAFLDLSAYGDDPPEVRIDLGRSHVRDQSAVAAIAKVRQRYRQQGKSVHVTGPNHESRGTRDAGVLMNGRQDAGGTARAGAGPAHRAEFRSHTKRRRASDFTQDIQLTIRTYHGY